jgi:hypothetical protein
MSKLLKKLLCVVLCVPVYPLAMLGELYYCLTRSKKFSLKKETKWYISDVIGTLKY